LDCSIIIVSYNVSELLKVCLQSLYDSLAHTPHLSAEIIVVDSASSDDSVTMVKTHFPTVKLIAYSENIGYTRGNNVGLAQSTGQTLFLLNPDTVIIGDALYKLHHYLMQHSQVGIVGPHTLNSDHSTQSSRRRFPTPRLAFFESTWLQSFAPKAWLDHFYVNEVADNVTLEVDWVQGSALMARRDVYEQIGGLDEGYTMYSEELDWCKRAKLNGWQVVYVGDAQIIHHGGKSSEQVGAWKHIHFQKSKLRYFRKYHGVGFAQVLRLFLILNYLWQIGIEGTKALLGSQRPLRHTRIQTYWQVVRDGLPISS
jgi:N-acetylglucosaminyl-diphospho-decaprenol L-rhamnosyltransferase